MSDDLNPVACYKAWRYVGLVCLYVQTTTPGSDRYSYTTDANKAKPLTEHQARAFCAYMAACSSVGYWG